jgi:hypothetical protein
VDRNFCRAFKAAKQLTAVSCWTFIVIALPDCEVNISQFPENRSASLNFNADKLRISP